MLKRKKQFFALEICLTLYDKCPSIQFEHHGIFRLKQHRQLHPAIRQSGATRKQHSRFRSKHYVQRLFPQQATAGTIHT